MLGSYLVQLGKKQQGLDISRHVLHRLHLAWPLQASLQHTLSRIPRPAGIQGEPLIPVHNTNTATALTLFLTTTVSRLYSG